MSRLDHGLQGVRSSEPAFGDDVDTAEPRLSREYLRHLRQLITMIERLAADPDLRAGVMAWRPQPYHEFFTLSDSRDAASALREYARIDPIMRRSFEAIVAAFDKLAADVVGLLEQPSADPERDLEAPLRTMRLLLDRAATLVEDGDTLAADVAGRRANRLYAR